MKNTTYKGCSPAACFFLFLILFSVTVFSQPNRNSDSSGNGIIIIKQFSFGPGDTAVRYWPQFPQNFDASYAWTYFIKQNRILRNDTDSSSSYKDTGKAYSDGGEEIATSFMANPYHPGYLIDLAKKTTYVFFEENGEQQVAEIPLSENTYEPFTGIPIESNRL